MAWAFQACLNTETLYQSRRWKTVPEFSVLLTLSSHLVLTPCNLSAYGWEEGQASHTRSPGELFILCPFHCLSFLPSPSFPLTSCIYLCLFIHGNTWSRLVFRVRFCCCRPCQALKLYYTKIRELCLDHSLFMFIACLVSWFLAPWIFCSVYPWPFVDWHRTVADCSLQGNATVPSSLLCFWTSRIARRERERERKRTQKGRDTVHFILPTRLEREFLSPPTESEKVFFFFSFFFGQSSWQRLT